MKTNNTTTQSANKVKNTKTRTPRKQKPVAPVQDAPTDEQPTTVEVSAKVSIYSRLKNGIKTVFDSTITVKSPDFNTAVAKVQRYAVELIAARTHAHVKLGKSAGKLFFKIEANNNVFTSETVLAQANFTNLISVSAKKLSDMNKVDRFNEVKNAQYTAIGSAVEFMQDVRNAASKADQHEPTTMEVNSAGFIQNLN